MNLRLFAMVTVLALAIGTSTSAAPYLLYDIDFSSPTHRIGETPTVGMGIDTPSQIRFGTPTVVSGFGALGDQPLVFNPERDSYEQIQLDLGQRADMYRISMDLYTSNLRDSDYAFTMHLDTPTVQNLDFHGTGGIRTFTPHVAEGHGVSLGQFTDQVLYHMDIDVDLVEHTWTIGLNGRRGVTSAFYSKSRDISSIRFNLSRWRANTPHDPTVAVALDNIRVTSSSPIPESEGALLFGLGFVFLIATRRRTVPSLRPGPRESVACQKPADHRAAPRL